MDPLRLSFVRQIPSFQAKYVEPPVQNAATMLKDPSNRLLGAMLRFENEFLGPESIAFDSKGRGPYTGVSDGRVLLWQGSEVGWREFATTSANRTRECDPRNPPIVYFKQEHICGRPLGLRFNKSSSKLYIADAYMGLMVVGSEGGQAQVLANEVNGQKIKFANDVDFDDKGFVYFTDTSTRYQRRQYLVSVLEGDNTGRLLRYDPQSKKTIVVLDKLRFPNGIAVNNDSSFILIAESITARLLRYWLKGPKAGTTDVFTTLPGNPDNVRLNERGEFWVAMYSRSSRMEFLASHPRLKTLLLRIPIPLEYTFYYLMGRSYGMVARYSAQGELLEILEDREGKVVKHVSEVEERDGKLWLGSVILPHIAVLNRQNYSLEP
ncbi:hypothetical protein SELMODRAFT_230896 [Selaginella moellendorffii]|uniref:Strictosidine synthase conserved region domain-containing protein n=1 Tax=Selaginella moellendorffii TaxID=88036 RepID=D8R516_SELML|nr:hypothetical protein SELMODRAFT_230896 [Selaginella moellendorffii]